MATQISDEQKALVLEKLEALRGKMSQQRSRAETVLGPEYVGRLESWGREGLAQALKDNVAAAIKNNANAAEALIDEILTVFEVDEEEPTTPTPTPTLTNFPFKANSDPWTKPVGTEFEVTNSSSFGSLISNSLKKNGGNYDPWFEYGAYSSKLQEGENFPIRTAQLISSKRSTRLHARLQQGVPMPDNAQISSGTDGHLAVYDRARDIYVEMWAARKESNGTITCEWGAVVENASKNVGIVNPVNGEMWGATATSLPVVAGVIYADECAKGVIPHALAMSLPGNICAPWNKFVWPALRSDGYGPTSAVPQGTRLKLPDNIIINQSWPPFLKMLVVAARDYGCIVRDQAGAVNFYGNVGDNFTPYFGGKQLWDFMGQFPYSSLQAVHLTR